MTSATVFLICALLLLVLVLAILLPPLWRKPRMQVTQIAVDRPAANLAIFRQQLAELERDRDEGTLAAADFVPAKAELQRRLLDEVDQGQTAEPTAAKAGGRKTALGLLFVLPLVAIVGYIVLGAPQALAPVAAPTHMDAAQVDAMLQKLADRLAAQPDDHKGWIILARSYKSLGRFAEAADAYSHGGELLNNDAAQLADYAEVSARANGGSFAGKPEALLARALALDAREPQALFLAGAAANDRRDFAAVVDYWSRLQVQLEPGSEEAVSLGEAVNKAREVLAQAGGSNTPPVPAVASPSIGGEAWIGGEVSISPALAAQAQPTDVLFIFARAEEGSRMPLAVLRRRVADLPLTFRLDDSLGLPGGQKLSAATSVTIEARVAKAGMAQSAPGDLYGVAKGVKPGSADLHILIDQVQE